MLARFVLLALMSSVLPATAAFCQSKVAAKPVDGLRDNRPRDFAIQHAKVFVAPGQVIDDATILIHESSITAVGQDVTIPAGYMSIDCTGKHIYSGLIDAYSEIDVPMPTSEAGYWNANVTPQRSAASVATKSIANADKLRSQGITVRLIAPKGGIVKGTSSLVLLDNESGGSAVLQESVWQHAGLTVPRSADRPKYPNSPMGAVALLRQSFYDARWYRDAWLAYRADSSLPRPETNVALENLSAAAINNLFVFDAPNERMAIRAAAIADEFAISAMLRGSGREYRQLKRIAALNRPILVPVNFPAPPDVSTGQRAQRTTLNELMHWDLAPTNPGSLIRSGLKVCLTTDGLDDPGTFLAQIRKAVDRGLETDAALAAVTTVPASLLKLDAQVGRLQAGMLANLVVTDGELFGKQTKILQTWVAGKQFVITPDLDTLFSKWAGTWLCKSDSIDFVIHLTKNKDKVSGTARASEASSETIPLGSLHYERDQLSAIIQLHEMDDSFPKGSSRLSLRSVTSGEVTERFASITFPDGSSSRLQFRPIESIDDPATEEPDDDQEPQDKQQQTDDQQSETSEPESQSERTPILFPLGGFGLEQPVVDQPTVIFRQGTVWTCGQQGVLENADVLVRDGLIVQVGTGLSVPDDCVVIDARGKHITPGLIDCHSHIATDGGINEYGQEVSAEVRIGDFIDNTDIAIYRQLAGGTTTANILHGSANPIGGQNQVIKFRWGETMDGLRMSQAPAGIKFALGENVKRNPSRYPNTRMGVEQILRDQLLSAREYNSRWNRWYSGQRDSLPPRRDLQLDAIVEVQSGQRWIHCHSYRQDEIIATLDVLEEFGIQIGTLQHILEGYKVADRMARHGAMGSSFSDWWAYKMEVFDAIPYNGALMHDQGIVVSFNSDDAELGRRLNTEAAKATKYGALAEAEALKFVTLNPAKQLRIDPLVGSIEIGKHADLVVWSDRPLSAMSRCEQSWIDGRRYFSIESDQAMRQRDQDLRARLIQKALASDEKPKSKGEQEIDEEQRWIRHDIFCGARGSMEFDQRGRQ